MPGAARIGDNHLCPMVDPATAVPHVGGPVLPPTSLNVLFEGLFAARGTDKALCAAPVPDFIVTGSATVMINGLPAARMTDKTMHGGAIALGALTVLIGGPPTGVTLGNPTAALAAFTAAASGRSSGSTQQSYQNCGVESARQIINQATHGSVTEDAVLNAALQSGNADQQPQLTDSGGTSPAQRQAILAANGVPSTQVPATMANIQQALAEGKGVITSHDVAVLWGPGQSGGHAIVATGVEYDASGQPANVIYNDTGTGTGGNSIPAQQYEQSLRPGRDANVTNDPIW